MTALKKAAALMLSAAVMTCAAAAVRAGIDITGKTVVVKAMEPTKNNSYSTSRTRSFHVTSKSP